MKKVISGLFISSLLIYFSFKGTDFQGVVAGLVKIDYIYILPFLLVSFLMQLIRTWRWGLILDPLGKVGYLKLFPV